MHQGEKVQVNLGTIVRAVRILCSGSVCLLRLYVLFRHRFYFRFICILTCFSFPVGDLQVQSLMRPYSKWILFKTRLLVRDHKSASLKSQFTFMPVYFVKHFMFFNGKIQPGFPASGRARDKLFIKIIWFTRPWQWLDLRFKSCHQSPNSFKCSTIKAAETLEPSKGNETPLAWAKWDQTRFLYGFFQLDRTEQNRIEYFQLEGTYNDVQMHHLVQQLKLFHRSEAPGWTVDSCWLFC